MNNKVFAVIVLTYSCAFSFASGKDVIEFYKRLNQFIGSHPVIHSSTSSKEGELLLTVSTYSAPIHGVPVTFYKNQMQLGESKALTYYISKIAKKWVAFFPTLGTSVEVMNDDSPLTALQLSLARWQPDLSNATFSPMFEPAGVEVAAGNQLLLHLAPTAKSLSDGFSKNIRITLGIKDSGQPLSQEIAVDKARQTYEIAFHPITLDEVTRLYDMLPKSTKSLDERPFTEVLMDASVILNDKKKSIK